MLGVHEDEDGDDVGGDVVLDKMVHDETSDSEAEADEPAATPASSSQSGALLPLDRAIHRSRKSYEEIPPYQASQLTSVFTSIAWMFSYCAS